MKLISSFLPAALVAVFALSGCSKAPESAAPEASAVSVASSNYALIDTNATPETAALYRNLNKLRATGVMFGHQDTLAYGVNWNGDEDRSDIRDMTGANPAVYGWDLGGLELGWDANLDAVKFSDMARWIKLAYSRGAVNTISWHTYNPNTQGNSWDKTSAVADMLPGGAKHEVFKAYLDTIVAFNDQLVATDAAGNSHAIPIVFRPWHEHNGDWFFWGKGHVSEADYIALWRFTVNYLRDEKGVRNFIYAFSPDRSRMQGSFSDAYSYGYPGDDYVDVIGLDNYWDMGHDANTADAATQLAALTDSLKQLVILAEAKNKLPALTEGGNNQLKVNNFFTERLLAAMTADKDASRIAWALVWRNANTLRENRQDDMQFFAAYPGHPQEADFKKFYASPLMIFEDRLPELYK